MRQSKIIFSASLIILVVPILMISIPILIWLLWSDVIKIAFEVQPFIVLSLLLCFLTIMISLGRYIFAAYMNPLRNVKTTVDNKFTVSTAKAAATLGITVSQVRILIKEGKLKPVVNHKNCWMVCPDDLTPENAKLFKEHLKDISSGVDIGLLEVSVGLTGVATTVLAVLPTLPLPPLTKTPFFALSILIAWLNLYTSLWLLGDYVEEKGLIEIAQWENSLIHRGHIQTLLRSEAAGPYWVLAITLVLLVLGITIIHFFMA